MRIPASHSLKRLWIVLIASALVATGCGDTAADSGELRTLRMGSFRSEVKLLNPWDEGLFVNIPASLIHSKLVEYAPDYRIVPMLAESWEISEGGKALTFHLKHGVRWHDDLPVTAMDAAFTLEFYKKHERWSQWAQYLERVTVWDTHTFTVHLMKDVGFFLLQSWLPTSTVILPEHVWRDVVRPREYSGANALVGCGPYRFEHYDPAAQSLTLTANPHYFGGQPAAERLIWRQFKSFDSLLLSMIKGDIDGLMEYYSPFPLSRLRAIEGSPVELLSTPDMGVPAVLFFNHRKFPMNDLRFREAVACAVNYEEILRVVAENRGQPPVRGFMPPAYRYFKQRQQQLEQNLVRAAGLLDQTGLVRSTEGVRTTPDGKPLRLDLLVQGGSRYPHLVQTAKLVARHLRGIGIEATPVVYDFTVADSKLFGLRDYDICVGRLLPLDVIAGCGTLVLADSPGNMGTCRDARLLALTEAFYRAKDDEQMRQAAWALQEYYASQLPAFALYHGQVYYPCRSDRFEGWTVMSGGVVNSQTWSGIRLRNSQSSEP
ncbi:ABC transporter substrate-binding protein [Desulfobacca acetoxidans]|uniref:ABC-type transporter, periplasmic subunit n=1 Tax=Desulfobacca acetoxidans (strain ATCC 700848 / DSM 11109 / ASRB2) TaxID=880072 RepID=F2NJ51_DESAR|nr:ABC transporter substrate-binding protein [Desulfobacca acetoxidans]AEB08009.1 ABC-type transporter, periplasmic subunit [Desulfobacca acetoxidans DSM 11109]